MDYKEKYNKLVEAIKVLQEINPSDEGIQNWVNDNVPELKVSEDERIRKELIKETKGSEVRLFETVTNDEFVAWLEKQGEQPQGKSALDAANEVKVDNQNCVKPAKVEPKFKVGDIIRLKDGDGLEWTVEEVLNNGYYTIVCADRDDFIQLDDKWELVEQKPAFETKTPEESLGIDSETYNKIVDECILGEQKPTWSEEDDIMVHDIDYALRCQITYPISKLQSMSNWILNIKDRVQPKQEWSEEDKYNLSDIEAMIHTMKGDGLNADRLIKWLKSLRPQSHWKPSDEQIIAINTAINVLGKGTLNGKQLIELQEQLKKLREE